jgi:hypothetical protein
MAAERVAGRTASVRAMARKGLCRDFMVFFVGFEFGF